MSSRATFSRNSGLGKGALLAAGAGAVWALHFQREAYVLSPLLVLVPLILLLRHPRATLFGWIHGFVFWGVSLSWLVDTLVVYGGLDYWLSLVLTLGLALYLGLYTCLFAFLGKWLWTGPAWAALIGWPALWVVMEWIRGLALSGFPWNLAGYALLDTPGALPASAWLGATGHSFLLVSFASGVALGLARKKTLPAALGVLLPGLILFAGFILPEAPISGETGLPVRVIQPNLSILEEWDDQVILSRYQKLMELSRSACRNRPTSGS